MQNYVLPCDVCCFTKCGYYEISDDIPSYILKLTNWWYSQLYIETYKLMIFPVIYWNLQIKHKTHIECCNWLGYLSRCQEEFLFHKTNHRTLLSTWINFIPLWISNLMPIKVLGKTTVEERIFHPTRYDICNISDIYIYIYIYKIHVITYLC